MPLHSLDDHGIIDQGDSDKTSTARQIENITKTYMDDQGTNDLRKVFAEIEQNSTWNTAASKAIGPLARLESFYREIFKVCKNGLIPRCNLRDALIQIDQEIINGQRLRR